MKEYVWLFSYFFLWDIVFLLLTYSNYNFTSSLFNFVILPLWTSRFSMDLHTITMSWILGFKKIKNLSHVENTTLPSCFFHSSSYGQTPDSLRCLPTTPCWVAVAAADGAEWAGREQGRVRHTYDGARSGADGKGEVSAWLCFTPVKTTSTKDSPNRRLLHATPTNPWWDQRTRGRSWTKAAAPMKRRLFAPPVPPTPLAVL
jgi:hypothetical protein